MAATTGWGSWSTTFHRSNRYWARSYARWVRSAGDRPGWRSSTSSVAGVRSSPAQKARPSPRRTTARTLVSNRTVSAIAHSSLVGPQAQALSFSGRLKEMTPTSPSWSNSTRGTVLTLPTGCGRGRDDLRVIEVAGRWERWDWQRAAERSAVLARHALWLAAAGTLSIPRFSALTGLVPHHGDRRPP